MYLGETKVNQLETDNKYIIKKKKKTKNKTCHTNVRNTFAFILNLSGSVKPAETVY